MNRENSRPALIFKTQLNNCTQNWCVLTRFLKICLEIRQVKGQISLKGYSLLIFSFAFKWKSKNQYAQKDSVTKVLKQIFKGLERDAAYYNSSRCWWIARGKRNSASNSKITHSRTGISWLPFSPKMQVIKSAHFAPDKDYNCSLQPRQLRSLVLPKRTEVAQPVLAQSHVFSLDKSYFRGLWNPAIWEYS